MLFLIKFIDLKKFFVHNLLRTSQISPFIIVKFDEQTVQIVSFEVNMKCVPLTVQAVVMKISGPVGVFSLWLCHCHAHSTCAYWALQKALTLVLLRLRFIHCQHIIAKLAVEVVDFFF